MKRVFFLLIIPMLCGPVWGASDIDVLKWDLETRISLGQFNPHEALPTKEMKENLSSLITFAGDKYITIDICDDGFGPTQKKQQLAKKRGQAILSLLTQMTPSSKLEGSSIEIVTNCFDQEGANAQGVLVSVYKPHQEPTHEQVEVVSEAIVKDEEVKTSSDKDVLIEEVKTTSDEVLRVEEIKTPESGYSAIIGKIKDIMKDLSHYSLLYFVAVLLAVVFLSRSRRVIRTDRLNTLSVDETFLSCSLDNHIKAKAIFNFGDVRLFVICDEVNSSGELKTFRVNADGSKHFVEPGEKWRNGVRGLLQMWLYGIDKPLCDFSLLEDAVAKKLVTTVPEIN